MKKLIMAMAVFVVTFGFVALTMAEAPMAAKTKASKMSGEVMAVDAQAKTVKVKSKDKEVTLTVTAKTKIKQGKEKKSLADLQAGEKVTTTFVTEGDTMTAKSIHITGSKK